MLIIKTLKISVYNLFSLKMAILPS